MTSQFLVHTESAHKTHRPREDVERRYDRLIDREGERGARAKTHKEERERECKILMVMVVEGELVHRLRHLHVHIRQLRRHIRARQGKRLTHRSLVTRKCLTIRKDLLRHICSGTLQQTI